MNKTVLFLINGLGIEHKDSCDIYSKEVMPTMDSCAVGEFFTTIESKAFDYTTGYQILSTGNTDALAFPFIDKIVDEVAWNQNTIYQSLASSLQNPNSGTLHIFCFLDSLRISDHLKSFITSLNTEKTIFIHPIMTNPTMDGYKTIAKTLYKLNYETLPNMKLGMVFGKNLLTDENRLNDFNDLGRMFFRGNGEKWSDTDQKLTSLQNFKILPNNAKTFCVNDQFALSTNDIILFYNYDNVDCSKFINLINNPPSFFNSKVTPGTIQYFSLFPIENSPQVKHLYDTVTSEFSLSKALKQINAKGLVLIDQENLNTTNFMINGLSVAGDGTVDYALTDTGILFNQEQMKSLIENDKYQLIVINHRIDQYNDENSMKQAMMNIDQNLLFIKNLCKDKYSLVISSLFGIKKEIMNAQGKEAIVDFSTTVPLIIIDSKYDKKAYSMSYGTLYTLLGTIIKLINPEAKVPSVLKKKGFIQKILFKK